MYYCPKCKVTIRGKKTCCPLCEGKILSGNDLKRTGIDEKIYSSDDFTDEYNEAFPILSERRITGITFIKLCTFILAVIIVICLSLQYLFKDEMSWTSAIVGGGIVAWLDVIAVMRYRYNILKVVTVEVVVALIVDYYIDKVTGFHGWSVVWMIPFCLLGHSVVTWIIAKIRRLRFEDYISYIVFDVILSYAQIYFIKIGENTLPYAAVFTVAAFTIALIAVILFRFRELKNATQKMFNV